MAAYAPVLADHHDPERGRLALPRPPDPRGTAAPPAASSGLHCG